MEHYLRSAAIAILLLLVQTTFMPFVALGGILPDLFILWLVYIAVRRGQIEAMLTGFGAGLLQDVVSTKFFGLAVLSKTVSSFAAGYFFNENTAEQTLGSYRYLSIVGLCSLLHNLIYFVIFLQGTEGPWLSSLIILCLSTTLYTVVVSVIPMFAFSQKFSTSWAQ